MTYEFLSDKFKIDIADFQLVTVGTNQEIDDLECIQLAAEEMFGCDDNGQYYQ